MIYGYIRVSTDKQTIENQRFEIENYLKENNQKVSKWISETISGKINFKKRKIGQHLSKMGKGDILICSELSRLGRNILDIMMILNICVEKGVSVRTVKEKYNLGQDLTSKILAFAFSLTAEIERVLISQRTKEALRLRKAMGVKLGRPVGTKNQQRVLEKQIQMIKEDYLNGISIKNMAVKYKVSYSTMQKFLFRNKIE